MKRDSQIALVLRIIFALEQRNKMIYEFVRERMLPLKKILPVPKCHELQMNQWVMSKCICVCECVCICVYAHMCLS